MPPTFSSPQVVCRPALPSDRASVLDFTRSIWDGHDYIKYVWDDWLADPHGFLAVAEYGGRAVALGKASYIASGQWWLEGLRVDPQLQGLKIGSHIFKYLHDWWSQRLGGTFRLMTSWERVEVHHLCERFGWMKIGEVKRYVSRADDLGHLPRSDDFSHLPEQDLPLALDFASAHLAYCGGLMDSDWRFATPDEATLAEKARQNQLYWWHGDNGLLATWDDEDDREKILGLAFVACPMDSLEAMLGDIRRLAGDLGCSSVLWLAPAKPNVEAMLDAAGYHSDWDGSAYLFEK